MSDPKHENSVAHLEAVSPVNHAVIDHAAVERANALETAMSFREGMRRYPWAAMWACLMTLTVVMEGYDTGLISSFYAYPSFVEKYGVYFASTGKKEIPAEWMLGLSNSISVGQLIGLVFNGWAMERFGHRRVMFWSLIPMIGFIGMQFAAPNLGVLLASELLIGIVWGIFTVMATAYTSEICPTPLRPYFTSITTVAWVVGQIITAGVLVGLVNYPGEWSYRIPFALQWVWPIPLMVIAHYAPESQWWLMRRGRFEEAKQSIRRLVNPDKVTQQEIDDTLAAMIHTDAFEKQTKTQSSYKDCFRGTNLRRTEIACMCLISQGWCGERFAYNPTYFFSQAGLNATAVYQLNLGSTAISFVAIFIAWLLMSRIGRRTIYIGGLAGMSASLLIIGCLATTEKGTSTWIQAAFAMVWIAFYGISIGPLAYSFVGEISATRTRAPTFALARIAYNVVNICNKIIEPYLINPTKLNLAGKTAFFWLGTNTLVLVWAVFRLPETRHRSFKELDILFEKRVPAWRFSQTKIENVGEEVAEAVEIEVSDEKIPAKV